MMKRPEWEEDEQVPWWVENWLDIDELLAIRFDELRFLIYGVYLLVVMVALVLLALGIMTGDEQKAMVAITLLGLDGLVLVSAFYLVVHL